MACAKTKRTHPPCAPLSSPLCVESCGIVTHHEIAYRAFETFNSDAFGGPGYVRGLMEKHKGSEYDTKFEKY